MDFKIEKKVQPSQKDKYHEQVLTTAYSFAKEAYGEFKEFTKAIVLFGSASRKTNDEQSDIDILIILDDTQIVLSKEVMETYKIICARLIQKISPQIHVTTLKYSTFFDYARQGDPIAINILRDGVALVDTGVFDPLQVLLYTGKIRPTEESIWNYYHRATRTLHNSRWHLHRAIEDLYWAVTDAAHAALMKAGVMPPTPEHISTLVHKHLVSKKILTTEHVKTIELFYTLHKKMEHKELGHVHSSQYEKYYGYATRVVEQVERYLEQ
ncbi:MAG: nucleotidyltransferase domain-containing protein [Candidatus Woesearchaeota archaeon]